MLVFIKFVILFTVFNYCRCDYKTVIGCENDKIYLKCRSNEVITIQSVFYGRQSKRVCPNQYADKYVRISSPRCVNYISRKCDDKRSCKIRIENSACGEGHDWYPDTFKHMEVKYRCCKVDSGSGSHEIPPPECGENMVLKYNATNCPERCPPGVRYFACIVIKGFSCVCREGFVLDRETNKCVAKGRCPYYNPRDPSETTPERYTNCGYCDQCPEDCDHPILCTKECKPAGYYCIPGYCRNRDRKCIRKCR